MTLLTMRYVHRSPFTLDAIGLDMPVLDEAHPNKAPFRGVLTQVDEASTRPPNGAQGHRVLIPRAVADAALPTLLGMAVDVADDLKDHAKQVKIGIITEATIEGKDVVVAGHLFAKDYPEEVAAIRAKRGQLGMSYEIAEVEIEDTEASVWTLQRFIFTGAAILRRDAAAYANTSIAAHAEEDDLMPGEASTILKELHTVSRQLGDLVAARKDDEGEDEDAKRREDDARRDEDDAKRDEEEAARARDDGDEDDAKRREADAKRKREDAARKRTEARRRYEDAAKKARDEDDEDAAKRFEEDAKRVRDEEDAAKRREEDAARQRKDDEEEDEDARRRDEEDGARQRGKRDRGLPGDDAEEEMAQMFALMLRGMGYDAAAPTKSRKVLPKDDTDIHKMGRLFAMLLKAMAYPGTAPAARRRRTEDAAKDPDEAQDIALFKRLMKQHEQEEDEVNASRGPVNLQTRRLARDLRDMRAAMDLITDTLKKQTGLITDLVQRQKNLATDQNRTNNGGPMRRTLAATGDERWVGQFEAGDATDGKFTLADVDAALAKEGADNRTAMARKLELEWANKLKTS